MRPVVNRGGAGAQRFRESEADTAAKVADDGPVSVADDDVVAEAAAEQAAADEGTADAPGPDEPAGADEPAE